MSPQQEAKNMRIRARCWMRSIFALALFASSAAAQNITRVLPTSPAQLPQAQVTAPAAVAAPVVQMRDVDRASVRIVALSGWNDARNARGTQLLEPIAGHGTGVLVSADGAILTARHVIEGAGIIAVFLPGEDRARPARVTFMDPVRDLAFLSISREATPFAFVAIPASAPALVASATVSASGYPLEVRERFPAAASGYLSRTTNDNRLQLAIPLNPGNSGGPVIDAQNVLIGIVSQGADPTRGAQGITIAEPAWEAYGPYQNTVRPLMTNTPHITDPVAESEAAHLIAGMLTDERGRLSYEDCLRAESDGGSRGPILALFGAYAWNRAQDDSTAIGDRTRWFELAERLIARAAQTPSLSQAPNFASIFRLHGCLTNGACRTSLQGQTPAAPVFATGVTPSTFTRAPSPDDDKPSTLPDWRATATVSLIHDELTQSVDAGAFRTQLEGAVVAFGDGGFRARVTLGGELSIGSWRRLVMFQALGSLGFGASIGSRECSFHFGGAWTPGFVLAEGRDQGTALGYRAYLGLSFSWIGVELGFQELSRYENSPYRALQTSLQFLF